MLDSADALFKIDIKPFPLMRQIPKTELSPDNGCVIDMKWKLGSLGYHARGAGKVESSRTGKSSGCRSSFFTITLGSKALTLGPI